MDRRLALVTGASAGIGASFARILASHGYDLALTARRGDRLDKLAEEISLRYGVEALSVTADLADPEAPGQILDFLTAHGRTVDALINNAGYGLPGAYADTRWDDQRAVIQVMITAPAELAHRVLSGMVHRRFGRIVNLVSRSVKRPQLELGLSNGARSGLSASVTVDTRLRGAETPAAGAGA